MRAIQLSPLSDPDIVPDPYPTYAELAETDPVHWWPEVGAWAVMRHADCVGAFRDRALSAERMQSVLRVKFPDEHLMDDSIYFRFVENVMMYTDEPLHGRLRRAVSAGFSGEARRHYAVVVERLAHDLVAGLPTAPAEVDAVPEIALRLPLLTATHVFGVPSDDVGFIVPHVNAIMSYWSGPREQPIPLDELLVRLDDLHEYASGLIRGERGAVPPGTAIARMLEHPLELTEDQATHQVVLMLIALFAPTTPGSISSGLLSFAHNPDQIVPVRDRQCDIGLATNEVFRYNASNQFTWRVAQRETRIGKTIIRAGDLVAIFIGSANRDGIVFDDPGSFRVERLNSDQHLTFGAAGHTCLGGSIASGQVQQVVRALFDRFRTIELSGLPEWTGNLEFRSLGSLPLRLL